MNETRIADEIAEVWGGHDDYRDGGWQYAAFVIREDLWEMEEAEWSDEACQREMTDVAINAIRALDELGIGDYEEAIRLRLEAHEQKGTESLIQQYQAAFENRL